MSEFFLKSISDEYDDTGNYIGNSDGGNRFHGVQKSSGERRLVCAACGSGSRKPHGGGGTKCANCDCSASQWKYR